LSDRPLEWMGSSLEDIAAMPAPVKVSFGYRLRLIQKGKPAMDVKALKQLGAGAFELREAFGGDAYRAVYVANLKRAIYVLHVFVKKSKSGIGLPRRDSELIATRFKRARSLDAEI
jgi:phage-related protein